MNVIYYCTASGVYVIVGEGGSSGCAMTAHYKVALHLLSVLLGELLMAPLKFA